MCRRNRRGPARGLEAEGGGCSEFCLSTCMEGFPGGRLCHPVS